MKDRTLKAKLLGIAGIITLAFAANAHATTIDGQIDQWTVTVDSIFDGTTIKPNPAVTPGVTISADKLSLRWGDGGKSGLDISNTPTTGTVVTNGAAVHNIDITHLNQPITGTTLTGVKIDSTLTLTPLLPSGPTLGSKVATFSVHYLETTNEPGGTCADGAANHVGVNINGCADIYVTDTDWLNYSFFYDLDATDAILPQEYFISFFESSSGLKSLSSAACTAALGVPTASCLGFETPENADTTVHFSSKITTEKVVIDVPEPYDLSLFGLALAGLGLISRRRKA